MYRNPYLLTVAPPHLLNSHTRASRNALLTLIAMFGTGFSEPWCLFPLNLSSRRKHLHNRLKSMCRMDEKPSHRGSSSLAPPLPPTYLTKTITNTNTQTRQMNTQTVQYTRTYHAYTSHMSCNARHSGLITHLSIHPPTPTAAAVSTPPPPVCSCVMKQ